MKVFRLSGLIAFILIISVFYVFAEFLLDRILKVSLEKGLSLAVQKPVEIENFKSSIFSLNFKLEKLQIVNSKDPYKNLVYIGKMSFDLNPEKLLAWKKYYIEEASIENLSFNTKREKPFVLKVEKKEEKPVEEKSKEEEKDLADVVKKLQVPSYKDILAKEKLKTVEVANNYKEKLNQIKEKWEKFVNEELQKEKAEIESLKRQIVELEKESKSLKTPQDYVEFGKKVAQLKENINKKINKFKSLKKGFNEDLKVIEEAYKEVKNASKEDTSYLKEKYSLDLKGAVNVSGLIFGEDIKGYLDKAIHYYKMVSPYLRKGKEKEEIKAKKLRLEGNYVQYKEFNPFPDIVIKRANISLNLFDSSISGVLKDFSDNQKIYKKPLVINFSAQNQKLFKNLKISSVFNRTLNTPKDSFNIEINNLKIKDFSAGKYINFEKNTVNVAGNANIIDEKEILGSIKISFVDTTPSIKSKDNVGKVLESLLSDIKSFFINIDIKGNIDSPKFSLNSNLDDIVSKRLKSMFNEKVSKLNAEINQYLNSKKEEYLKEIYQYKDKLLKYKDFIKNYENSYKDVLKEIKEKLAIKKYEENLKNKIKEKIIKEYEEELKDKIKEKIKLPF